MTAITTTSIEEVLRKVVREELKNSGSDFKYEVGVEVSWVRRVMKEVTGKEWGYRKTCNAFTVHRLKGQRAFIKLSELKEKVKFYESNY